MRDVPTIIQIGDCLVSSEIFTEFFACDYPVCKGVCCVYGDSGAPMEESETEAFRANFEHYSPLMSEGGIESVRANGFSVRDREGDLVTPLVRKTYECAYCNFDADGGCFCTVERAWFQGQGSFRKPISCWLYPIRLSVLSNGLTALNLHRWDICRCAFEKGRRDGVRVYEFLREPLIRYFGEDFYDELVEASRIFVQ